MAFPISPIRLDRFKRSIISLGLAACVSQAEVQITMLQEDLVGKTEGQKIEMAIGKDKLRVDIQGSQPMVMIYRQDKGLFWLIQPTQKTYTEMTLADMESMAKTLEAARAKLTEQMQNLPEEQRQMMEKMMGNMMPPTTAPKVSFKKALGTGKVGAWTCQNWESYLDGVKNADHCVADFKSTDLKDSDFEVFKGMAKFVGKVASSYKGLLDQTANLEQLGGIPVQTTVVSEGKAESRITLQSVKRAAEAGARFDLPAGLAKKAMPSMPSLSQP
jgi:hypothetical protein